ncbi:MAG: metallophosphoesterase [Deltaproteobacteria bacterium]|nr:metallophosphoesterase [Deltaproteobacteria bacterium]
MDGTAEFGPQRTVDRMRIGLISDSHDRPDTLKAAVDALNEARVAFVIHAGDFVAPFTLKELDHLDADWRGVFGNNDGERVGLEKASKGRVAKTWLTMQLQGRTIGVIHDESRLADDQLHGLDLLVCGHTHRAKKEHRDGVLVVNPGELCGYLTGRASFAVMDLETLDLEQVILGA